MIAKALQDLMIQRMKGKLSRWKILFLKVSILFDGEAKDLLEQYKDADLLIDRQIKGQLTPFAEQVLIELVETLPEVGMELEMRTAIAKNEREKVFKLLGTCPEYKAEQGILQDLLIKMVGNSENVYDAVQSYKPRSKAEERLIERYKEADIRIAEFQCEKITVDDMRKLQADIIELPGIADTIKKEIPIFEDPKIKNWLNETPPFDYSLSK